MMHIFTNIKYKIEYGDKKKGARQRSFRHFAK